jgi:hypothetical protein
MGRHQSGLVPLRLVDNLPFVSVSLIANAEFSPKDVRISICYNARHAMPLHTATQNANPKAKNYMMGIISWIIIFSVTDYTDPSLPKVLCLWLGFLETFLHFD